MSSDFTAATDPWALFDAWLEEAEASEPNDPTAMAIATVASDGLPDARMVLMRGHDARGVVFYTNFESAKGRQLGAHPKAAALFHWKSLRRQVRLRGAISVASAEEADAYFAGRPRNSRLGAWASHQSRPLASRAVLEKAVADLDTQYAGHEVPRPPHWSGFRLTPSEIEFWKDGAFRLHDRVLFRRIGGEWEKQRLYP